MKIHFTILLLFIPTFLFAQHNLVPNAGFEEHQGTCVSLWEHAQPPYYHYTSLITPHSGKYSMGLCIWKYDPTEYFQIKLNEKLEKGLSYELEMYARYDPKIKDCLNDDVTELGCYFSDTAIYQKNKTQLYSKPQIVIPLNKNILWAEKRGSFTAKGDENYLIIGKFFDLKDRMRDTATMRLREMQIQILDNLESERDTKINEVVANINSKYETNSIDFDKVKDKEEKETKLSEYRDNALKSGFEIRKAIASIEKQYAYDIAGLKVENYCRIRINIDDISLKKVGQRKIKAFKDTIIVGEVFRLKNIFFETDESKLLDKSFIELDKLYLKLKHHESFKIEISGHTDNIGSDAHNLHLSEMRSKAVVNYLISKGIDKARMTHNGFGSSKPVASNSTEEGRAENRRVEFKVKK